MNKERSIVLGVTHARSLGLLSGVAERLSEAGWDVHIVTAPGSQTSSYAGMPIHVHTVPMARKPSLWRDLRGLFRWVDLIKTISPDVVFVGTPKAGLLGILSAWMTRVPVRIYHLRGLRLESTRGMARKILWCIEQLTFQLSTSSVAVSSSLESLAVAERLVPSHKVTVLGKGSSKGVDIEKFTPGVSDPTLYKKLGLSSDIPVIGFVGRLTRDKGSHELLDASHKLAEWGVDHQLLIVGDEDDSSFMAKFATHRLSREPVITGRVVDSAPYYRMMDILCLPTYREGFPNVVLEAGASGLPTVTTDATGAVDSVVEGHTGMVVPKGTSEELARALRVLLSSEDKRQQMGRAARDYVSQNFERSLIEKKIVEYLEQNLRCS